MSKLYSHADSVSTEHAGSSNNKMFIDGTDICFVSPKKQHEIRILPAFDPSSRNSPEYATSYYDYRDTNKKSLETGHPGFTMWCTIAKAYSFFGPKKLSFFSPYFSPDWPGYGEDPIFDLYTMCKKSGDPDLLKFIDFKVGVVPLFRTVFVMNVLYRDVVAGPKKSVWRSGAAMFSKSAFDDITEKLDMKRGAEDEVIGDPKWSRYMLGDVTHPVHGLLACTDAITIPNGNMTTVSLVFSETKESLTGYRKMDITDMKVRRGSKDIGALESRYDFHKQINFLSYAEALELLVDNIEIPYDIIVRACSEFVGVNNVPKRPNDTYVPVSGEGNAAAATPAKPATPPPPTAPAKPAETSGQHNITIPSIPEGVFIYSNGKTDNQVRTVDDLVEILWSFDLLTPEGIKSDRVLVCPVGSDAWKKPIDVGFVEAKPTPPTPPAPAAPAAPSAPAAPAAPATPATPSGSADGAVSKDRQRLNELLAKFEGDGQEDITTEEMAEFNELQARLGA